MDNFDTEAELKGWLETEAFRANPIGVEYDVEELAGRYRAGEPLEELVKQGAA